MGSERNRGEITKQFSIVRNRKKNLIKKEKKSTKRSGSKVRERGVSLHYTPLPPNAKKFPLRDRERTHNRFYI